MKSNRIKRDFTFAKYIELCKKMLNSDYSLLTVEQYLRMEKKPEKFIIIRHDVDDGVDLPYTLKMAIKEAELGITATYYFRTHDDVFQPDIIKEVADLGHEIGYHYNVLGEAEGDYARAIKLFEIELSKFKGLYDIKTIAMHGGPMKAGLTAATFSDMLMIVKSMVQMKKTFVPWDSKDLWKKYDFRKYDIIGDAYLSIDFNEVAYISDTNISWSDTKHRLKDFVEGNGNRKAIIKNTDNLIGVIKKGDLQKILILVHPPNWRDEFGDWLKWLMLQQIKNAGKTCLKAYWNFNQKKESFLSDKNRKNMKKDIGVVVIGDHVQALGIIRSLGRRGIPVYLLHDKNLCIGRFSRYTKRYIKTPSPSNESEFKDFMIKLAIKDKIRDWILMPTNDAAVHTLSRHKGTLDEYYRVSTPSWDIVKLAYNKKLTYQIAEKNSIPIPNTFYPENIDEIHEIATDVDFPVIIKPAIVDHFYKKTKTKVFKANTKDELIQAYIKASHIIDPSEIMVQEVIPGSPDLLYSVCSFFKDGKVVGMFSARRSRQRPMDFGSASTFVESVYVPEIIELGAHLLKAINYYGLSEVEFKKDPMDGKFKLLEVNARTWCWHSLAIRCGVDFPYLLYKDMIGEVVAPVTSFRENVKWIHIYTDLGVVSKEVLKGKMRLKDYFASLKGKKEFAVFSLDDPLPFIAETLMLPYLWIVR